MKKVLKSLAVTSMVLGLAVSAQAANNAQVTLTSPAIVKDGCEKIGSVTFTIDEGTVLTEGDWLYMDLPSGTTFCSDIDYFIGQVATPGAGTDTITYPAAGSTLTTATADDTDVDLGGGAATIGALTAGTSYADAVNSTHHILENVVTVGAGGVHTAGLVDSTGAAVTTGGGGVVLRVTAASGGQRAWIRVMGNAAGGLGNSGTYTVSGAGTGSSTLNITLADGQAYEDYIFLNTDTDNDTPTIWGDDSEDQINMTGTAARGSDSVPHIENSFCANAESMSGTLMFTSFDSLNSFITFTGDAQIAHVASDNPVSLAYCSKAETSGNIEIGGQEACTFNYEDGINGNYCTDFGGETLDGGRIFIQGTTTFGNPDDLYDMTITSDTAGVYFTAGATLTGFTPSATDECEAVPTGSSISAAFTLVNEAGDQGATAPGSSCTVAADNRVRTITTGTGGAITGIDTYDAIWVNLPAMVYDTSIIGDGIESDITISVTKYPCGTLIDESMTIGTFVTTCPTEGESATSSTLLFPFMPAMDGSMSPWWGGFTIVNGGTAAGTCDLTFTEADGDTATYTTSSIAAAGQWNAGALSTLLTEVTPDSANAGTFGDANVAINAVCGFGGAGGFAFTGNTDEGTGYTAYSTAW